MTLSSRAYSYVPRVAVPIEPHTPQRECQLRCGAWVECRYMNRNADPDLTEISREITELYVPEVQTVGLPFYLASCERCS